MGLFDNFDPRILSVILGAMDNGPNVGSNVSKSLAWAAEQQRADQEKALTERANQQAVQASIQLDNQRRSEFPGQMDMQMRFIDLLKGGMQGQAPGGQVGMPQQGLGQPVPSGTMPQPLQAPAQQQATSPLNITDQASVERAQGDNPLLAPPSPQNAANMFYPAQSPEVGIHNVPEGAGPSPMADRITKPQLSPGGVSDQAPPPKPVAQGDGSPPPSPSSQATGSSYFESMKSFINEVRNTVANGGNKYDAAALIAQYPDLAKKNPQFLASIISSQTNSQLSTAQKLVDKAIEHTEGILKQQQEMKFVPEGATIMYKGGQFVPIPGATGKDKEAKPNFAQAVAIKAKEVELGRELTSQETQKVLLNMDQQKSLAKSNIPEEWQMPDGSSLNFDKIPKSIKNVAEMIANYNYPYPGNFALARPEWVTTLAVAKEINPQFDASQWPTKLALRKDFTSGTSAKNITSLNTAVGHIDSLVKAYKALDNSGWPMENMAVNLLSKYFPVTEGLQERQGTITGIKTKFNAVKGEMAGIFKANGSTDIEIKSWSDTVDDPTTATPKMWKAFIDGSLELMGSRIDARKNQYEQGMGQPKDFRFLSPGSRKILDKLGVDTENLDPIVPSRISVPGTSPDGGKINPAQYDSILSQNLPNNLTGTFKNIMSWENASGDPTVESKKNKNGTVDIGLFQINEGNIPQLQKAGIIKNREDLKDPTINTKAANYLFQNGGFSHWKSSISGHKLEDQEAVRYYLSKAKGDTNKARELAKNDGWTF